MSETQEEKLVYFQNIRTLWSYVHKKRNGTTWYSLSSGIRLRSQRFDQTTMSLSLTQGRRPPVKTTPSPYIYRNLCQHITVNVRDWFRPNPEESYSPLHYDFKNYYYPIRVSDGDFFIIKGPGPTKLIPGRQFYVSRLELSSYRKLWLSNPGCWWSSSEEKMGGKIHNLLKCNPKRKVKTNREEKQNGRPQQNPTGS